MRFSLKFRKRRRNKERKKSKGDYKENSKLRGKKKKKKKKKTHCSRVSTAVIVQRKEKRGKVEMVEKKMGGEKIG